MAETIPTKTLNWAYRVGWVTKSKSDTNVVAPGGKVIINSSTPGKLIVGVKYDFEHPTAATKNDLNVSSINAVDSNKKRVTMGDFSAAARGAVAVHMSKPENYTPAMTEANGKGVDLKPLYLGSMPHGIAEVDFYLPPGSGGSGLPGRGLLLVTYTVNLSDLQFGTEGRNAAAEVEAKPSAGDIDDGNLTPEEKEAVASRQAAAEAKLEQEFKSQWKDAETEEQQTALCEKAEIDATQCISGGEEAYVDAMMAKEHSKDAIATAAYNPGGAPAIPAEAEDIAPPEEAFEQNALSMQCFLMRTLGNPAVGQLHKTTRFFGVPQYNNQYYFF